MTFVRRLANITAPVVRGLYCSSFQNLVKKPCMKSRYIVKVSLTWAHCGGGHGGRVPPLFQARGHNMPCPTHFFLFRFCIWRGFKNKVLFVTFCVKSFSC